MPGTVESALHEAVAAPLGSQASRRPSIASKICTLTVHDERFCKQSVLVSPHLFAPELASQQIVLQITPHQDTRLLSAAKTDRRHVVSHAGSSQFVFTLQEVDKDVLASYPGLEISLLTPIATALGLANRSRVLLTEVGREEHLASHVEIAFKDAFITRADMWRLLTSDLVGTTIYKNQKVLFINSVKANVKAIYAKGRRVQSALLDASTKAIFRSDSSRYYILLQMSREMWDFDADGGGEIMFNKVINGFLPELFHRWEVLGTSHSVSVLMFTRMEYEDHPTGLRYQDYYRVLTTELLSSESEVILKRLKREFRNFLRDVSISQSGHSPENGRYGEPDAHDHGVIRGRPAAAINGNILEAIHTASLQFLRSNATCDLRRTGLSIIVITPGTGIFEVEHDLLIKTTDTLIEDGIYIDLVCLSKMPLHSSPLFRYRTADALPAPDADARSNNDISLPEWQYTIPHWVDVSFWQTPASSGIEVLPVSRRHTGMSKTHRFVPRVRMHEIQMSGLMQNELEVTIAQLPCPHSVRFPSSFGFNPKSFNPRASIGPGDLEGSKAMYNEGYKELGHSSSPQKSVSQSHLHPFSELSDWMDQYDDKVFKPVTRKGRSGSQGTKNSGPVKGQSLGATFDPSRMPTHTEISGHAIDTVAPLPRRKTSSASTTSKFRAPSGKFNPLSRQFGPGFKGFGAAKATATTYITADAVVSTGPEATPSHASTSSVQHSYPASSTISRPSTRASSVMSPSAFDTEKRDETLQKSKPIDIKPQLGKKSLESVRDERELMAVDTDRPLLSDLPRSRASSNVRMQEESGSPSTDIKSPWMTMLNPSNPKKLTADMTRRLGRWQHVFPKPTQASTIKWKSLCSPACLPLTTEDFPTSRQLNTEYKNVEYEVKVPKEKEANEDEQFGEWLIRELVGSRLTRGFSVVVGTRPAEALGLPRAQWYEFLHEKGMSRPGVTIIMSQGTEIHELYNVKSGTVRVTRYIRTEGRGIHDRRDEYYPLIKTAYAHQYVPRKFSFLSLGPRIDWERLDNYIACDEEQLNKPIPESLRYWRARFVLIPIAVSGSRKRNHSPEDNDEEIRLEGIRKLTEMWQRNRFVSPNERKYESKTRKDMNPLDIVYQTRSASAVVSELKDSVLADSSDQKPTQLLPEKELFERAKFSMTNLAKALQGEKGIRLRDRRWHWRLHYHCFIGLELITWLTNNFRDIDTREEAVEFGNQLMLEGLFVHVERRHNFRDGNFFYQISEKYRATRQDGRSSWFGRLATSVPPTPLSDKYGDDVRTLGAPESSDKLAEETTTDDQPEDAAPLATGKAAKASVVLSKRLVYDLDHRRKSQRRELVNLHVDRISSADDCYHVRIDWVTATPKLIEDSVEAWATTAERSGLRFVEVPLLEAWRFEDTHPFRHPYYIKLAKDPPRQPPQAAAADAISPSLRSVGSDDNAQAGQSPPTPRHMSWPYHKAILKKFDFVLDLEAAEDFPDDVAVTYSWGKPEYRSSQYITRSGRLLAQITPDGRFLLLINQLFKGRGSAGREATRTAAGAGTLPVALQIAASRPGALEGIDTNHATPRKAPITPGPISAPLSKLSLSPFASPMLRASAATGVESVPAVTPSLPQPVTAGTFGYANYQDSPADLLSNSHVRRGEQSPPKEPTPSKSELLSVTQLRIELEEFCSDAVALERFYDEELHRPLATVPATPIVRPMSSLVGVEEVADEEPSIPHMLHLRDDTPAHG